MIPALDREGLAEAGLGALSVAHDLNTPLTVLAGDVELLRASPAAQEPGTRELVDEMAAAVSQAIGLVRAFRALGSAPQAPVPTDLAPVVSAALLIARGELRARAVTVETTIEPGVPRVHGVACLLQRVLFNLAINAAEAMEQRREGGHFLYIRVHRDDDGARVFVELEDTGSGMAPETRASAFEPFFSTKGRGSGLGLHAAREIVRALGGDLELESRAGVGTTARVFLRAAEAA